MNCNSNLEKLKIKKKRSLELLTSGEGRENPRKRVCSHGSVQLHHRLSYYYVKSIRGLQLSANSEPVSIDKSLHTVLVVERHDRLSESHKLISSSKLLIIKNNFLPK